MLEYVFFEGEVLLFGSEFRFISDTGGRCFPIESSRCSRFSRGRFCFELKIFIRIFISLFVGSLRSFVARECSGVVLVRRVFQRAV